MMTRQSTRLIQQPKRSSHLHNSHLINCNSRAKVIHHAIDPILLPWLLASGSLTQQLTQLAQGQFRVQAVSQHFAKPSRLDSQWLHVPAHELVWLRRSLLFGCDVQPWVKAHSFFPLRSLSGQGQRFRHLGNRPVGQLLFERTRPSCERRVIKLPEGWTRQSCYTWHGKRLIVQETFLPAFIDYLKQHPQQSPL